MPINTTFRITFDEARKQFLKVFSHSMDSEPEEMSSPIHISISPRSPFEIRFVPLHTETVQKVGRITVRTFPSYRATKKTMRLNCIVRGPELCHEKENANAEENVEESKILIWK